MDSYAIHCRGWPMAPQYVVQKRILTGGVIHLGDAARTVRESRRHPYSSICTGPLFTAISRNDVAHYLGVPSRSSFCNRADARRSMKGSRSHLFHFRLSSTVRDVRWVASFIVSRR